jgi:hypothetical protein
MLSGVINDASKAFFLSWYFSLALSLLSLNSFSLESISCCTSFLAVSKSFSAILLSYSSNDL